MRAWERENYQVVEVEFDHDLHEFMVLAKEGGEVFATITPASLEDMASIIEALDNGEDVNGWEDGNGNTISTDAVEKGMELAEFKEKFVEAFDEYCKENCFGDTAKLINLQERFGNTAIEHYDSIVDNGKEVTEAALQECIEYEKENLEWMEYDK